MMDIFKRIFRRKDPEVRRLIRELNNSVGLEINNKRIPTVEAVRALGETCDPDAGLVLWKAWKRTGKFIEMLDKKPPLLLSLDKSPSQQLEALELAKTYAKQIDRECLRASYRCNTSQKDK